jgi:hypothetical protein
MAKALENTVPSTIIDWARLGDPSTFAFEPKLCIPYWQWANSDYSSGLASSKQNPMVACGWPDHDFR